MKFFLDLSLKGGPSLSFSEEILTAIKKEFITPLKLYNIRYVEMHKQGGKCAIWFVRTNVLSSRTHGRTIHCYIPYKRLLLKLDVL